MRAESFERLFEEHAPSLLAFLTYRTGDPVLADDLVADTFERVLRARQRFDPRKGSERTWIYAIAINLLRDHGRRTAREGRALDRVAVGVPVSTSPSDRVEQHDELIVALSALSEDEREVIALRFGADLTARDIARVLDQTVPAVEARLYRSLGKLRAALASPSDPAAPGEKIR